ncbi:MAG: MFS transporter [Propionibacterium sp.]|nr:MFS transporter [Propionibacterium sp.]
MYTAPVQEITHVGGVRSSNFLRFWTGQTLAQFGARLAAVALPVLAVELLSASEQDLGYLNAAQTAAFLVVGLPAGAWIDRWFKRRTMISADLLRFVASFAVPLLWFTGQLQIWHLYVIGGVVGIATVFFDVAYQSFVPVLVPEDEIGTANARLETTSQIATMGGPALGGLALKVMSAPFLMLADAFGYLASVVFLSLTRDDEHGYRTAPHDEHPQRDRSLVREIREGLDFVVSQPALRRIVACTGLSNLFATMGFTLVPLLVLRQIGLSPFLYGVVMTASSVGGAVGASITPALQRRLPIGSVMRVGILVAFAAGLLQPLAGVLGNRWLAFGALVVADVVLSVGVLIYNITQVSLRQRLCPKNLLGRMNASVRFVVWGVLPISALAGGWLGQHLGLMPTMWLAAGGAIIAIVPLLGIDRHLPASA